MDKSYEFAIELVTAERRGLKIAIVCRTVALGIALIWWIAVNVGGGGSLSPWSIVLLVLMLGLGGAVYPLIGTPWDRWWLKYLLYAVDVLGVCAAFALVPLRFEADVPQIFAFRAYGIYFLFPLIALACLTLSWRLVLWSGVVAVAGWWAAYGYVISGMASARSWADFPMHSTTEDFLRIFLSADFIGRGSRMLETGVLLMAATILAIAVWRARRVFFAQLQAEAEREAERQARARITNTLGRYVPETLAQRLLENPDELAPQERYGVVLIADIESFTRYAARRKPREVIANLNEFLGAAATAVAHKSGIVIQFTGDGLIATFNAPVAIDNAEVAAFDAGRALVKLARTYGFEARVGLAAGQFAAGSIGSIERQAFTVYGETVNKAARLEVLGKSLNANLMIDERCANVIGVETLTDVGQHQIAGFDDPISVWTCPDSQVAAV